MIELDVMSYVEGEYEVLKEYTGLLSEEELNARALTIFQVGSDKASEKYISNKKKKLDMLKIPYYHKKYLDTNEDYERYIKDVMFPDTFNNMLQLPAPDRFEAYVDSLGTTDVDGLSELNIANFYLNKLSHVPCTARGILEYMRYLDDNLEGKSALIINRSNLVGNPLRELLIRENMLVTVAHSYIEKDRIQDMFKDYDYIISGVGIPKYFDSRYLVDKNTFIDVGINFDEEGKMCGDLDLSFAINDFKFTPVPRGVGQLTVLSLMKNILFKLSKL